MKPACRTCRFWEQFAKAGQRDLLHGRGTCQRYPPILDEDFPNDDDSSDNANCWIMPVTDETEWCGEWSERK